MTFRELHAHHTARPFEAYRIVTADGRSFEIPHPEFAMIGLTATMVGIPTLVDGVRAVDAFVRLANEHVTACIPLVLNDPGR